MSTNPVEDLEALKRVSGLIADRVFNAQQVLEGDSFLEFRDKAVDFLGFIKVEAAKLEKEIEQVKIVLAEEEPAPDPVAAPPVVAPKDEDPKPALKPALKPSSSSQKKLDELMDQVTKKNTGTKKVYAKAFAKERISDQLKQQLRNLVDAGEEHVNPQVLEDLSAEFGVSKLRIAEYVAWLNR